MAVVPPPSRHCKRGILATVGQIVMIPLNWLEVRSGIVGGVKYFLSGSRPLRRQLVPDARPATLTAFLVQLGTGVILAMYYKPTPDEAYESIRHITHDVTLAGSFAGCTASASVFIILLFLHMGRVFLFGAYKYPRELNWLVGVLILPLALLMGFTGYLLPWDQTAYWATVVGINLNGTGPFVGPFLAQFLRGGDEIGEHADDLLRHAHAPSPRGAHRLDLPAPSSSSGSALSRRHGRRRRRAASGRSRSRPATEGCSAPARVGRPRSE